MNAVFIGTRIIESILLPPLATLLMLALAAWVGRRHRRAAWALAVLACSLLLAFSLPAVSSRLRLTLEGPPLNAAEAAAAQAIVVLGSGNRTPAPEYGHDVVNGVTLDRLRYAAHLQRLLHKPILVTGGSPTGRPLSEGEAMQDSLMADFHTEARWVESTSENTFENARNSYAILVPLGVTQVIIVTDGWHMRRAHFAFMQAGFKVLDAPSSLGGIPAQTALAWIPSADALSGSQLMLREWLGIGWYRLQSALGRGAP